MAGAARFSRSESGNRGAVYQVPDKFFSKSFRPALSAEPVEAPRHAFAERHPHHAIGGIGVGTFLVRRLGFINSDQDRAIFLVPDHVGPFHGCLAKAGRFCVKTASETGNLSFSSAKVAVRHGFEP